MSTKQQKPPAPITAQKAPPAAADPTTSHLQEVLGNQALIDQLGANLDPSAVEAVPIPALGTLSASLGERCQTRSV